MCRVLSHEFGVVRLYRTFIFTGETRCAGCSCTSSGWFKRIESPRTFSNHIITERARCVEFCHLSSGWFDCTEPFEQHHSRGNKCAGCVCTSLGWFKRIEPPRTVSNLIIAEIARCVDFFRMSSGWFDCTEPSLPTSLQGKQGLQGAYALVRGGSSTSNLLEPSQTTS